MTDNELLLAISNIVEAQVRPLKEELKEEIRDIKLSMETDLLPRLQNIESCYTSTYKRYQNELHEMETLKSDVNILKRVVTEHSVKLEKNLREVVESNDTY